MPDAPDVPPAADAQAPAPRDPAATPAVAHAAAAATPPEALQSRSTVCLTCGYALFGLDARANCPECGTPVARSLFGLYLRYASPDYIRTLHTGLILIEAALVLFVVFTLSPALLALLNAATGRSIPGPSELVAALAGASRSAIGLAGWYLFTQPDPGLGTRDIATRPRRIVRACVIIQAVAAVIVLVDALAQPHTLAAANPALNIAIKSLPPVATLLAFAAWAVQFFAAMTLLRLLGYRAENPGLVERARRYQWLVPGVFILGSCVLVGPLIAFVMYFIIIEHARRAVADARAAAATLSAR